jgi:hypothetical protein
MKRSPLRPGKKCKDCKGSGKNCNECNGRGFIIKAIKKAYKKTKPKSKRHAINLEYSKKRKRFMLLNPRCQVLKPNGKTCGKASTDCHHRKGRAQYMLEEATWLSTCAECHSEIHTKYQEWARRMGYLLNPASKEEIQPPSQVFFPYENSQNQTS